jgi:hypothetical protein
MPDIRADNKNFDAALGHAIHRNLLAGEPVEDLVRQYGLDGAELHFDKFRRGGFVLEVTKGVNFAHVAIRGNLIDHLSSLLNYSPKARLEREVSSIEGKAEKQSQPGAAEQIPQTPTTTALKIDSYFSEELRQELLEFLRELVSGPLFRLPRGFQNAKTFGRPDDPKDNPLANYIRLRFTYKGQTPEYVHARAGDGFDHGADVRVGVGREVAQVDLGSDDGLYLLSGFLDLFNFGYLPYLRDPKSMSLVGRFGRWLMRPLII